MSASISLLRSRRKVVENCDDSGEESDCSIKDPKKKESIEKGARAIAAINMLTVSMVNQLLEQQGLDPFGKSLSSPSLDDEQSWGTPVRTANRQSITRSIKENTLVKKSRKSVRFTPDTNRTDLTPGRSCDSEKLELTHTKAVPLSALRMEPKFTPLRRSKVLKAGMLRSLENEQDIESVDNTFCTNDIFDSPLPVRNLAVSATIQSETVDDSPMSPSLEVKSDHGAPVAPECVVIAPECGKSDESTSLVPPSEKSPCEGIKSATVSKLDETVNEESDQNEHSYETPIKPRWTHHFDPTSPEHMSPFLKTLLEERAERSQGKELSKSLSMLANSEDQPRLSVLKGVIAFVEVRRADEDRSSGFRWKLNQLGAQVEENFTKKVTHVVFQEGLLSTYRKAKESNVHLVSACWVMACDESTSRVPEDKYPIDEEDKYSMLAPLKKYIRRPKLMSPSLGDDNDEKRLARRLQAIKRRSMKIEGVPTTEKETNDGAVASSSKTKCDSKTLPTPKKASLGKKPAATSTGSSSSFMSAWLTGKKNSDARKDKTEVSPIAAVFPPSASTRSPRKRTADAKSIDSPVKQKARLEVFDSPVKVKPGLRSFDSPLKTKSSARYVDSPVKTKSSARSVDSPVKTKSSARPVDSPVKTKSNARSVNSPVKTKSSARSVDSPVKTKSSARSVDSPVKTKSSAGSVNSPVKTKSSARSVNSPVKTKSSARSVDSPLKTKSSARSVDSPLKTKSNARFVDLPVKTKSSIRSVDSPVKTKSSARYVDSPVKKSSSGHVDLPVKTKSSSRSFDSPVKKSSLESVDSPKKAKLSSKTGDLSSTTSVSFKSNPKRTPPKRDLDKKCRTPAKNVFAATSSVVSESRGRILRSTPTKTESQSSSTVDFSVACGEMLQKTPLSKPAKGISGWLATNKAALTSPAKRTLSGALKGVTSSPARRTKTNTISEDSSVSVPDLKSPEFSEGLMKKARVDSCPLEEMRKNIAQKLLKPSPKKQPVSGAGKALKSISGGHSQSKDNKKKISPRGTTVKKSRSNDKSQTVLTSHFRLLGSPNEDTKEKVPSVNVSEGDAVLAPSTEEDRTMQLSHSLKGDERQSDIPALVNTSSVDDSEMPLASPTENQSNVVPLSTATTDVREELHESADVTEEQAATAELCEGSVDPERLCEEQLPTDDKDVKETSALFDDQPVMVDVNEEQPLLKEGRATADVCEEQPSADVVVEAKAIEQTGNETFPAEETRISADVSDEQPISADPFEEQMPTPVMNDEQTTSADLLEERIPTPVMSGEQSASAEILEERTPTPVVNDEQPTSADLLEEKIPTSVMSEEQPTSADLLEEKMPTPVMSVEQSASAELLEERTPTPVVNDEQPTSADLLEEKMPTPVMSDAQSASAELLEERTPTPVVNDEQPTSADLLEEKIPTPVMSEEQPTSADLLEEKIPTPVMSDAQSASAELLEERTPTPVVNDEQPTSADLLEERMPTPVMSDEQLTSAEFSEERVATPVVSEEQTTNVLEELGKTFNTSEEETTGVDILVETRTLSDVSENQQIVTIALPGKSSGSVSRDTEESSDSFSSFELPSSGNSTESGRKRTRKSLRPANPQSPYRTRRSMRFVTSNVPD